MLHGLLLPIVRWVETTYNFDWNSPLKLYFYKINTIKDTIKFDKTKVNNPNAAFEYGSKVKTGTDLNHLFIFLTSITMIMMMQIIDLPFHIDCTYKLCEIGCPV